MATEIIAMDMNKGFAFVNKELQKASEKLSKIANDLHNASFEVAEILGEVLTSKCYEEDGFKSVGDFAEQVFGIKKANAYQMANVGARFLDGKHQDIVSSVGSVSKLAELLKMEDGNISGLIESGAISTETTQKELRAIAKDSKPAKDAEPEVVDNYNVWISRDCTATEEVKNAPFSPKAFLNERREADTTLACGIAKATPEFPELVYCLYRGEDGRVHTEITEYRKVEQPKPAKANKVRSAEAQKALDVLHSMTDEEITALILSTANK